MRNQNYTGQTPVTFPLSGLPADHYLLAIVDRAGNQSNLNITVTPPPPPTLTLAVNNEFLFENFSGIGDPADIPSTIFMSWPAMLSTGGDGSFASYGPFNLQVNATTGAPPP